MFEQTEAHDSNNMSIEEQSDTELIAQAKNGDREAFGELFRRHHRRAYRWASSLVQDTHMAEDIVQEALLKSFLHLGTLMENNRFLPWLQRIVRNHAYNRLKSVKREQPFTGTLLRGNSFVHSPDWNSLDDILNWLRLRRPEDDPNESDPSIPLLRQEWFETIRRLLRCLTNRERTIFEAYFFRQLTPKEIAQLFQTTTGNVYMVLSRSKKKLSNERILHDLNAYISQRRLEKKMVKTVLQKPRVLQWKSPFNWSFEPWTTAGFNLYGLLENTSKSDMTISKVLGLSGQSFRLNIVRDSIHTAGATMYDWNRVLPECLRILGFRCKSSGAPSGVIGTGGDDSPHTDESIRGALSLIQKSIDEGRYVLAFDLTLPSPLPFLSFPPTFLGEIGQHSA